VLLMCVTRDRNEDDIYMTKDEVMYVKRDPVTQCVTKDQDRCSRCAVDENNGLGL